MVKNETTAEVGIDVVGGDLNKSLEFIERKVKAITVEVVKAGNAANKAGGTVSADFDKYLKGLQATLGQLRTIQNQIQSASRGGVNNIVSDSAFANRTRQASKLAQTYKNAENAAESFQARLNALDRRDTATGSSASLSSRKQLAAVEAARQNLAELKRLDAELARLDVKAQRTTGNFTPERQRVSSTRTALDVAATGAGPQRLNFNAEFAALNAALGAYGNRLAGVRAEQALLFNNQRALNTAEVRAMTSLEGVKARIVATDTERARLSAIIGQGTKKQQADTLELLRTEEARMVLLSRQARVLTPAAEAAPGAAPKIFGNAGITGVIARTAGYAAAGAAIYGVVGAAHDGIAATIEFEESLDKLGAISGSTETQMQGLRKTILSIAEDSKFSSSELVAAATELAQAGYSASGIQASLKAANDLAIGSGSSIAQSVDVMTASMGAFQLQEQDATMVANGLTAALNKSRLALPQVALGIQYAGVTAKEQNISFQELTSAMAAMAQAGVRSGSTMGTGIRQFLTDLASPTEKLSAKLKELGLTFDDVDVSTLGLPAVLQNLSAAGFSASEAYGSMEKRGAAAYLAMKSQLPIFNEVNIAMSNQTAAADAAAKAGDNLASAWQRAKNRMFSGWEELAGPMDKVLARMLDAATGGSQSKIADDLARQRTAALIKAGGGSVVNGRTDDQVEAMARVVANYRGQQEALAATEQQLTTINDKYAESLEVSTTATQKAAEAFAAGKNTLLTFEDAMASAIRRSGSLKDGSAALQAETISLANRYPDLARNVDSAKTSYMSLIDAMRLARGDMLKTNAALALSAGNNALGQSQILRESRDAKLAAVLTNPQFKKLPKPQQDIIRNFQHDATNGTKVALLTGVSRAQEGDTNNFGLRAFRELVGQMATDAQRRIDTQREGNTALATNSALLAAQTPALLAFSARVEDLSKPGSTNAAANKVIGDLRTAQRGANPATTAALETLIVRSQSNLNQTGSFATPKASGATANRQSNEDDNVGSMTALLKKVFGNGTVVLDNSKHRKMTASGKVSDHWGANARALDFIPEGGMGKHTADELEKMLEDAGVKIRRNAKGTKQFFGPGKEPPGSKGKAHNSHGHVAWEGKADPEALERKIENFAKGTAQRGLKNADKQLKQNFQDLKDGFDQAERTLLMTSFEAWETKINELTTLEVQNMYGPEKDNRLDEAVETIRIKREELSGQLAQGIVNTFENQLKLIQEETARTLAPTQNKLAQAQGTLEGLDRYGVSKNVPSYVRTLAERRVNEANEANLQAQLPATGIALDKAKADLALAELNLETERNRGGVNSGDYVKATQDVKSLSSEVTALAAAYANMQAQAGAPNIVVTSLSGNLGQALQEWQELHVNTKNYAQLLGEEVGPALDYLQGSFENFFSEALSGATSLLGAFGNLAKGIIQYIQQIVIKLIASKLIEMLTSLALSFLGPSVGSSIGSSVGGRGASTSMGTIATAPLGSFNGGPVLGRAHGGPIETGFPGRDSTHYKLARGEYVVRSAAVKSVGQDFMKNLNNNGSRALAGLQQMPMMPAQTKQEVAVYVVAPQERPSMGPSDVIVTLQQDMLKDGATKKLIKFIAQGG